MFPAERHVASNGDTLLDISKRKASLLFYFTLFCFSSPLHAPFLLQPFPTACRSNFNCCISPSDRHSRPLYLCSLHSTRLLFIPPLHTAHTTTLSSPSRRDPRFRLAERELTPRLSSQPYFLFHPILAPRPSISAFFQPISIASRPPLPVTFFITFSPGIPNSYICLWLNPIWWNGIPGRNIRPAHEA